MDDNLNIQFTFYDERDCGRQLEGEFSINLYLDGQYYDEQRITGVLEITLI